MEHQEALGIRGEQKKALITETERGNPRCSDSSGSSRRRREKLVKLSRADQVDEAKVKEALA